MTIVVIGPLTNLALSLKLDDEFKRRPERVIIMGGNYYGEDTQIEYLIIRPATWQYWAYRHDFHKVNDVRRLYVFHASFDLDENE